MNRDELKAALDYLRKKDPNNASLQKFDRVFGSYSGTSDKAPRASIQQFDNWNTNYNSANRDKYLMNGKGTKMVMGADGNWQSAGYDKEMQKRKDNPYDYLNNYGIQQMQKKQALADEKNSLLGKLHLTSHTYKTNPVYTGLGNFFTTLNTYGERFDNSLTGTLFPKANAKANQAQADLIKRQLKKNPNDKVAKFNAKAFNDSIVKKATTAPEKLTDLAGATAGTLLPYMIGDGILGVAGKGVSAAAQGSELLTNPLAKLAVQGGLSGLTGSGLDMSAKHYIDGQNFTPGQIATNLGINAGAGAVIAPAAHFLGTNLNLKGQMNQLNKGLGYQPFNAEEFQKALQETYGAKGDISNVLRDPVKPTPTPYAPKIAPKPKTMNDFVPKEIPKVDVPPVANEWFNFAQSGKGPQARGNVPTATVGQYTKELIGNKGDNILNQVDALKNAPKGGYNQRLLDVQKEMQTAMDKRGIYRNPLTPDELYLKVKQPNDPATFDDLIKMAQMEHTVSNQPVNIKTLLRNEPKIAEGIKKLNALGGTKKPFQMPTPDIPKVQSFDGLMNSLTPSQKPTGLGSKASVPTNPLEALQNFKSYGGKADIPKVTSNPMKGGKLTFPTILKSVKTTKTVDSMSHEELQSVYQQLEQKLTSLSNGKGKPKDIEAVKEDINRVKKFLQFFSEKTPKKSENIAPTPVKKNDVTAPNPIDEHGYGLADTQAISEDTAKALQQSKDILPNQTLTKNIYELVARLPKEIGTKIKTSLDTAKINHVNNLEQRTNDLYTKVVKGLGINKGSKESALVQDFGEKTLAKDYLRKQGIDPSTVSEEELNKINLEQLKQKTPKWENVVKADEYFRENYNQLIDEVNSVRAEIYPNNPDKIVPMRNDYYHHFNELNGFEGFKNLLENSAAIDPHLAGISPNTKPNAKWQSFMQKRGNGAYKSDAVGGYLKYLQASSHSTHIDPVIKVLRQSADQIATATEGTRNLNNLKTALVVHADNLAGKTNPIDRLFQDHLIGRKAMSVVNFINGHIKKNMILGNLGSALGQVGNVPLAIGKAKQFAPQGLLDTLGFTAKHLLGGGEKNLSTPIAKSQFLKERFSGKYFTRFDNGLLKTPEKMAAWMLETADKAGSYFTWNSMYRKGLAKGIADPVKYADEQTRHIIAGRGVGEVPIAQKAKITQLVVPFSLEVGNQWKVLGKQMSEKDFAGVITFLAASYGLNEVMNQIKGSDVSFNPVGAVMDGYNKTDGNTTDKLKGAGANLLGETVGNIPGGNYLPQILGLKSPQTKEALFGNRSPDRFGTGLGVASTVFKPATDLIGGKGIKQAATDLLPLIMPFGGNQAKKTFSGIDALSNGGSYTSKGELQYPVNSNNNSDLLHSLLLGPTTTSKGQDYYDNNRKPLSGKQTQQYQNAPDKQAYYDNLMYQRQVKAIQNKIKDIKKNHSLTPQEKQTTILELMARLQKLQK